MARKNKSIAFKDDVGVELRIYTGADLSTVSSMVLKVKKPSQTIDSWVPTIALDNSKYAVYITDENDLNEVGVYLISLEIITADGAEITGETSDELEVFNQFEDICE